MSSTMPLTPLWQQIGVGPLFIDCFGDDAWVTYSATAPADDVGADAADLLRAGQGAKQYAENVPIWVKSANGYPARISSWG